jgi:acyl carrier protein
MNSTTTPQAAVDEEALHTFLRTHLGALAAHPLSAQTPLLGQGLLDSLGVVQLMVFLGGELGVEIDDEDFTQDNLATLGSVLALISRKRQIANQAIAP